jgi:hypothetical protein
MLVKAFVIWLVIAAAEVAQGAFRVRFLNRSFGDRRARQLAVFSGSAIILFITWWLLPWTGAATANEQLGIGFLWLVLMLAFDIAFGRWVFHASWSRIAADFDPRKGGLLGLGMFILFLAPLIVSALRARH